MSLRIASLTVWLSVVFGVTSCVSADEHSSQSQQSSPVAANSVLSAERVALGWWKALRARDAATLVDLLTPPAQRTLNLAAVRSAVRGGLGRWSHSTGAVVLYSERTAEGVTVYMRIAGGDRVGPVLIKRGSLMLALPLVVQGGDWRIDNAAWLRAQVKHYAWADRQAEARNGDQQREEP